MANHRIGTITLDFTTDQKDQAWTMQKQFEQLIAFQLIPELEKAFDQIDQNDVLIFIDQMNIHLGILPVQAFHKEFVENVVTQILNQLAKISSSSEQSSFYQLSKNETIVRAFGYFLRTGTLPDVFLEWFYQIPEQKILEALKSFPFIQEELSQLLQKYPSIGRRLFLQFTQEFSIRLAAILKITLTDEGLAETSQSTNISETSEKETEIPLSHLSKPKDENTLSKSEPIFSNLNGRSSEQEMEISFSKIFEQTKLEKQPKLSIEKFTNESLFSPKSRKHQYISNAGLVLIHPYISGDNDHEFSLFEELGLTKNHQFKDFTAQERALHILQYLVWGKENQPEFAMVLDKILCGVPAEQPVQRFISLTEVEKQACARVAELISADWRGISEISLEALRETFLQRMGKLSPHSMGYQLQVEGKTQDIILSRLPYGLSVIKFLWMEKYLWIEW